MTKEVTTTTAKVELDDYTLKVEGILDESNWEVTMSFKDNVLPSKSWNITADIWQEEELEELVWREVMRITKKYAVVSIDHMIDEVEEDDE
jgi:hypothetical protein